MRSTSNSSFSFFGLAFSLFICSLSAQAQGTGAWWKSLFQGTQKSMCDSTSQVPAQESAIDAPGVMIWDAGNTNAEPAPREEQAAPVLEDVTERPEGSLVQQCDERILSLDSAWHTTEHILRGFRIQLFSGSLQAARQVRAQVRNAQDTWPVYLSSMPPNYRVTMGDFRSRWEAERAQDEWLDEFPMAIVIPMNISLPALREGAPAPLKE